MTSRKFYLVREDEILRYPLVDWSPNGAPIYLNEHGYRESAVHLSGWPNRWSLEEEREIRVIPGGGWRIARIHEGRLVQEPVIAWQCTGDKAEPVVIDDAESMLAYPPTGRRYDDAWLVPPGEHALESQYRWDQEAATGQKPAGLTGAQR